MKVPFIDLQAHHRNISIKLLKKIEQIFYNADFVLGRNVTFFEKKFAEYCGVNYCIGVNSGTDAIFLALKSLDLNRGDEVITAANTFVATVEAIKAAGCRPILVDILPDTYNLNPDEIKKKITKKTRVIMPVHLYGQPVDMDPVLEVAKEYNLFVIEDAAQAHGAMYKGKKVGSLGDVACFSFYPTKNLGACGDAGAIVTNNEKIASKLKKLRNHGGIVKYQHDFSGYNSRLDSIQAAILTTKLEYLDQWNRKRQENAEVYNKLLKNVSEITTPKVDINVTHVYHLYVIKLEIGSRDQLRKYLKDKGIITEIHYPRPIHFIKAFRYLGYKEGDFPIAEECAKKIISLPMYPSLRHEQIEYVVQEIKNFIKEELL